jgi:ActR/RegA family two-component response regulator
MPAQVVIVHNDWDFATEAVAAFKARGYSVAHYHDALAAMIVLPDATSIELLITCLEFGKGRSNGVALANMVRLRKQDARFIFIGPPDPANEAEELGVLLTPAVTVADLLAAARADN